MEWNSGEWPGFVLIRNAQLRAGGRFLFGENVGDVTRFCMWVRVLLCAGDKINCSIVALNILSLSISHKLHA